MLVWATSTPVIATKEKAVEIAETAKAIKTAGASKDGKSGKSGKYLQNLVRVLCIRYPIIFWKKFVSMSAFFDSSSEVNANYSTFV